MQGSCPRFDEFHPEAETSTAYLPHPIYTKVAFNVATKRQGKLFSFRLARGTRYNDKAAYSTRICRIFITPSTNVQEQHFESHLPSDFFHNAIAITRLMCLNREHA
jgi:hypothetical protein